jgi:hypothetical protein
MKMKIIVCIVTSVLLSGTSLYAQYWPTTDQIVSRAQSELSLDAQQLVKVRSIIGENMSKRQSITPQLASGLTQAQSKPLDYELYQQLSEVLTRDQMNKWNRVLRSMLQETYEAHGGS